MQTFYICILFVLITVLELRSASPSTFYFCASFLMSLCNCDSASNKLLCEHWHFMRLDYWATRELGRAVVLRWVSTLFLVPVTVLSVASCLSTTFVFQTVLCRWSGEQGGGGGEARDLCYWGSRGKTCTLLGLGSVWLYRLTEGWYRNFFLLPVPRTGSFNSLAEALGPWFFLSLRNNLGFFVLHFRATESTHPHAGSPGVSVLVYNLYILKDKPNWCPSVPPSFAVRAARWSYTVRIASERMSWCHHLASRASSASVGQRP